MTVPAFPTLPTDNLYKFIALFGLALFLFGSFFPDEKITRGVAQTQDAEKAFQLAKIRLQRKVSQIGGALKEVQNRLTELGTERQALQDAEKTQETKRESLMEEMKQQMKQQNLTLKAAKEVEAQMEGLNPELQALGEKVRKHADEVRKRSEEVQGLQAREMELADEIEIEKVNVKAFTDSVDELNFQVNIWFWQSLGCIVVGFVMMLSGFQLWYKKIQVHQDAILQKQANDFKADKTE
jgi:seryl-tRNA synthetase